MTLTIDVTAVPEASRPIASFASDCVRPVKNISSVETFCLAGLGEEYRCDTAAAGGLTGKRDYGGLLINRVGRPGYKINFQLVGLLWNFR